MIKSESIKEITKALSAFQGAVHDARFDSKNPHFKSEYASLEAYLQESRKLLSKNGLAVSQGVSGEKLETILLHISGEFLTFEMPLLFTKQDMQGLGSALTYARRYSLGAILGIGSDKDDDAEGTKGKSTPQEAVEGIVSQDNELGNYVVKFGKKLSGKMLKDIDPSELSGYLKYLDDGAQKTQKPLTGAALELYQCGWKYLDSLDRINF